MIFGSTSAAIAVIKDQLPDCSIRDKQDAWQYLVDTGVVWRLGSWYSNMAAEMLSAGTLERNEA